MRTASSNRIEVLPALTPPITLTQVETWRDGSVEVELTDSCAQSLLFWFDGRKQGRLFLKMLSPETLCPIAQDSEAEWFVVDFLRRYIMLNYDYAPEELEFLASFDWRNGSQGYPRKDHRCFWLRRCVQQVEELRKLAVFGVIERI